MNKALNNRSRQGSNSLQIRHYNERVVLETIRRLGTASKAEIARHANLTPQAVATIIDALHDAGYLLQIGKRQGKIGQPSVLYATNPVRALSIGLHIGRRAMQAVVIDMAGQVLDQAAYEYDYPAPDNIQNLAVEAVHRLEADLEPDLRQRLIGVGVSMPYFFNGWQEDLGFPADLRKSWATFNLPDFLEAQIRHDVFFENDASAAAITELMLTKGEAQPNFIYFYLGTIIGGGLVMNANLETGLNGNAAAFNTFPVSPSTLLGAPPPAGSFEILQRRASVYVLLNHLRSKGIEIKRVADLTSQMQPWLEEWETDCAQALAQAVIGAVALVDIGTVIIDGLLPPHSLARLVAKTEQVLSKNRPEGLVSPVLLQGRCGIKAPAIGAALLPFYANFTPNNDVLARKFKVESKPLLTGSFVGAAR